MENESLLPQSAAAKAMDLPAWEIARAQRRGVIEPRIRLPRRQGGSFSLYAPDDLELFQVLGALRAAGVRLVDIGPVLRRLRAMPDAERRRFLRDAVAARWPGSKRWDLYSTREDAPDGAEAVLELRGLLP